MADPLVLSLFAGVMVATYVAIAYEGIHKTTAALVGAGAVILLGVYLPVFPYGDVYAFLLDDLSVIGVIVGTGILVTVTSRSGLFQFIGIRIVKATRGNRLRLFLYLNLLTFLFVSFLTIVPSMLIVAALTLVACRTLEYDPKPFLISEAIVANSGALTTFASSLPNLIIGTAADIPYEQFLVVTAPFAVLSLGIGYLIIRTFYGRELMEERHADREADARRTRVEQFDEWSVVKDMTFFRRSGVILLATVVGFAVARRVGLGLDFVALSGATAALLLSGVDTEDVIRKVNWSMVLFFVGLFTLVAGVEASGLLEVAAEALVQATGGEPLATQGLLLWFSGVASGFVDNIPVSATLVPIVFSMSAQGLSAEPLWWAVILGANLGGSLTPVGSVSCVIALHSLETEAGVRVSWKEFMKVGSVVVVLQMAAATAYLFLLSHFNLIPTIGG